MITNKSYFGWLTLWLTLIIGVSLALVFLLEWGLSSDSEAISWKVASWIIVIGWWSILYLIHKVREYRTMAAKILYGAMNDKEKEVLIDHVFKNYDLPIFKTREEELIIRKKSIE